MKFKEPVKGLDLKVKKVKRSELEIPPFQRDVSEKHIENLMASISKLGFLTFPIVFKPKDSEKFWIVDGQHRIYALDKILNTKDYEIPVIIIPNEAGQYILNFNIEKPPTIKEKSIQIYRLYKEIINKYGNEITEVEVSDVLEQPYYITIGIAIEGLGNKKLSVSPIQSIIKKVDNEFFDLGLEDAQKVRENRAKLLNELDKKIKELYYRLKEEFSKIVPYEAQNQLVGLTFKSLYGERVRKIDDDFETVFKKIIDNIEKIGYAKYRWILQQREMNNQSNQSNQPNLNNTNTTNNLDDLNIL